MLQNPRVLYGLLVVSVLAVGTSGYLLFQNNQQSERIDMLLSDKDFLQNKNDSLEEELATASSTITMLSEQLTDLGANLDELADDYRDEKNKNEDFEDQLRDITKTVGVLDKLSKTDKELLQKYSKVYFLNEHYVPESLRDIDKEFVYNEDKVHQLHSKVMPYFEDMVGDAKDDNIDLWVVSSFRSFETQAQLKGQYVTTYGSGANTFSADQGYSEHQLGTTIDFTTSGLGGGLNGFENTPAYEWLVDNAYKYGFTLSYPKNNAFYVFEPWHWRFVGTDLAKDLDRANASFYDWEQRKIDEYLISVFD